jgi:hypothetical protein
MKYSPIKYYDSASWACGGRYGYGSVRSYGLMNNIGVKIRRNKHLPKKYTLLKV